VIGLCFDGIKFRPGAKLGPRGFSARRRRREVPAAREREQRIEEGGSFELAENQPLSAERGGGGLSWPTRPYNCFQRRLHCMRWTHQVQTVALCCYYCEAAWWRRYRS
ncbi:hypothetical protein JOB18_044424, partial [Solea senegalensis]